MRWSAVSLSAALTVIAFATTPAQSTAASRASLSLGAGTALFDLSGTGWAPMVAMRGALPLGSFFAVDGGVVAAWPAQQFMSFNTLLVPEVGMEFHLPTRVAAYLGADVGRALNFRRDLADAQDISYSGAFGTRFWMTERRGLVAEFRLRGIGQRFTGAEAEYTLGMVWR